MGERMDDHQGRRAFLIGASAVAVGTMLESKSAEAMPSRYAQSLRFGAEGDARLDWVLSLLPLNLPPLPLGTVIKARYEFPASDLDYRDKDVMSLYIYTLLPFSPPVEVPVSALHVAVEDVIIASASYGGDDNPENNLVLSGRVISVETLSPFGDLIGRAFNMGCGFIWDAGQQSTAVFKLLAGSAAGSHVTVLEEADGYIEIKRPWGSF